VALSETTQLLLTIIADLPHYLVNKIKNIFCCMSKDYCVILSSLFVLLFRSCLLTCICLHIIGILERGITIEGLGSKSFLTYESNILFALRFMIDCNIVGGNWIEVPAGKYRKAARVMSYCQLELDCLYPCILLECLYPSYKMCYIFV
jgi:DNA polymerase elongation subunit (family B)